MNKSKKISVRLSEDEITFLNGLKKSLSCDTSKSIICCIIMTRLFMNVSFKIKDFLLDEIKKRGLSDKTI